MTANEVNITKTTLNMAAKRDLFAQISKYDGDLEIYEDEEDCEPWIILKPSKDKSLLQIGFCFNEIEDCPHCIPNNDKEIRNFIKEAAKFKL